jgi:hypothetical protein
MKVDTKRTDDIKAEEEGEGGGLQGGQGGAVQTLVSALLQLSLGGMAKAWALTLEMSHVIPLLIVQRHQLIPVSPAHQHLSYRTLMTLELTLVARFLGEALAEAGTSGTIPTHFEACTVHDCAVQGGEDDATPL